MEQQFKVCQSCSMPLKKDVQGGGTNADGSKTIMYCSKCYVHGLLTNPEIDGAEKMQAFVKFKMKEMGIPCFLSGFFTRGIPKLKRCQSSWHTIHF